MNQYTEGSKGHMNVRIGNRRCMLPVIILGYRGTPDSLQHCLESWEANFARLCYPTPVR